MNKTIVFTTLSSWLLLLCWTTDAVSASNTVPWQLIAASDYIAKGTLHIPVEELKSLLEVKAQNQFDFQNVKLTIDGAQSLKGLLTTNDLHFYYGCAVAKKKDSPCPKPNDLFVLEGQQVVVFLDWSKGSGRWSYSGKWPEGFYLHYNPKSIQPYSVGLEKYVLNEIKVQTDVLKTFNTDFPPEKEILYPRVKSLVEKLVVKEAAMEGFHELRALGTNAIPSVILLLDDRRPVDVEHLIWDTGKGAQMTFRPGLVIDTLDKFLSWTTGEHYYGSLPDDKIRFWKLYLHYLRSKGT